MNYELPVIDRETFDRYTGLSLPRHVAYPMPSWWNDVDPAEAALIRRNCLSSGDHRDLSLYLHLPFCEHVCRFCACNKVSLKRKASDADAIVEGYIDAIVSEARSRAALVDEMDGSHRRLRQIHWGGGTPTFLTCEEIVRLHTACLEVFDLAPDAECSIEIDPRSTSEEQLVTLRSLGFNRISFGVQDFDPKVQEHVNRIQPLSLVQEITDCARKIGFESVNFDLIYGLPFQSVKSVVSTIEHTLDMLPDRIAFYHYAQIPDRIAMQRGIDHGALPTSEQKLTMLLEATVRFVSAGYTFIGLDHFARPDERLAKAFRDGTIHRSFQGMTTGGELDLIGIGCSAISVFPRRGYVQNERDPRRYADLVRRGEDPVIKGLHLGIEDGERQTILMDLYCYAGVCPDRLLELSGVDVRPYLASAGQALVRLERDGLIVFTPSGGIQLTNPLGRVLMRNVAAVFDAYLPENAAWSGIPQSFSSSA